MKLGGLVTGGGDASVTGFAIDHRKVAPGTIFGAFEGTRVNGEDFIPAAVSAGAIAVVARPDVAVDGALHIASDNPRQLSRISLLYSSRRSRKRWSRSPAPTARPRRLR